VAAGDVIAHIDDRDYRIALQQAEAQVSAARASIENIDAQLDVQQAQISANQANVDQVQAGLVFAEQQPRVTSTWGKQALAPYRMPSSIPRNCISSRPHCRVRRRPSSWHSVKSRR
jgi:hypothetical protein